MVAWLIFIAVIMRSLGSRVSVIILTTGIGVMRATRAMSEFHGEDTGVESCHQAEYHNP